MIRLFICLLLLGTMSELSSAAAAIRTRSASSGDNMKTTYIYDVQHPASVASRAVKGMAPADVHPAIRGDSSTPPAAAPLARPGPESSTGDKINLVGIVHRGARQERVTVDCARSGTVDQLIQAIEAKYACVVEYLIFSTRIVERTEEICALVDTHFQENPFLVRLKKNSGFTNSIYGEAPSKIEGNNS